MNHDCAGHHDRGGYRYTVHVPCVSHNRRFSCPLWICLRCDRPHRDAQQETTRPPSHRRHPLLLVALRGFRLGDAIVVVPLGPGLPSIYPRHAFLLRGISGPHGSPAPLARLGPIAPHRDGLSYILLLTAFYVDNGHSLPIWKDLPNIAYWVTPAAIGIPLVILALLRHPLAQRSASRSVRIAK